jgi:hypothetical protein
VGTGCIWVDGGERMNDLNTVTMVLGLVELVMGMIFIPLFVSITNLANGVRCQLRHDMLHIYYEYKDTKKIRQYELENFVYLYKAYKALKGNSFIDKIYKEVMTWEVVT